MSDILKDHQKTKNKNVELKIEKLEYAFDSLFYRYQDALRRIPNMSESVVNSRCARFYDILDDAMGGIHDLELQLKEARKKKEQDDYFSSIL